MIVGSEVWVALEVNQEICMFGRYGWGLWRGGRRKWVRLEGARDENEQETGWWAYAEERT